MKHIYCKPTIKVAELDTEEIMVLPLSGGKEVSHGSIVPGTKGNVYLREDITDNGSRRGDENMGAKGSSFDFDFE